MLKYLLKKLIYSLLGSKSHHHRPPTHKPYGYHSSSDWKHRPHNHHGRGYYRGHKHYTSS